VRQYLDIDEICGSRSSVVEVSGLLGCDTVLLGKFFPLTFTCSVVSSFLRAKQSKEKMFNVSRNEEGRVGY
jgi:hypothetical protein